MENIHNYTNISKLSSYAWHIEHRLKEFEDAIIDDHVVINLEIEDRFGKLWGALENLKAAIEELQ